MKNATKKELKKRLGIAGLAIVIGGMTPLTAYILQGYQVVQLGKEIDHLIDEDITRMIKNSLKF